MSQGKRTNLEELFRYSLELDEKGGQRAARQWSHARFNLVLIDLDTGNLEDAERLARRTIEVVNGCPFRLAGALAAARSQLGEVLLQQGRYAEAEAELQAAHAPLVQLEGPSGMNVQVNAERLQRLDSLRKRGNL